MGQPSTHIPRKFRIGPIPVFVKKGTVCKETFGNSPPFPLSKVERRTVQRKGVVARAVPFYAQLPGSQNCESTLDMGERGCLEKNVCFKTVPFFAKAGMGFQTRLWIRFLFQIASPPRLPTHAPCAEWPSQQRAASGGAPQRGPPRFGRRSATAHRRRPRRRRAPRASSPCPCPRQRGLWRHAST